MWGGLGDVWGAAFVLEVVVGGCWHVPLLQCELSLREGPPDRSAGTHPTLGWVFFFVCVCLCVLDLVLSRGPLELTVACNQES